MFFYCFSIITSDCSVSNKNLKQITEQNFAPCDLELAYLVKNGQNGQKGKSPLKTAKQEKNLNSRRINIIESALYGKKCERNSIE